MGIIPMLLAYLLIVYFADKAILQAPTMEELEKANRIANEIAKKRHVNEEYKQSESTYTPTTAPVLSQTDPHCFS